MTEFKQGDKVTHKESHFWPHTYTVVEQTSLYTVRVTDPDGRKIRLTADYLTKVEEPGPKVGDRVRLVHEGVVTATTGRDSGTAIEIDGNARLLGRGETVEILERAPKAYAPGTVAVYKDYHDVPIVRDYAVWRTRAGIEAISTDVDIAAGGDWKVVYEPPQSA